MNLQRGRESTRRVMKLQAEAIKDAIREHLQGGGATATLEDAIDSIMLCVDPLVSSKGMKRAQEAQLWNSEHSYTVKPRRRILPNGGIMYDLPF